jgi:hypothetical protein
MNIKKFTQFISENEHYSSINEGDIVPGVPYNSAGSGAVGSISVNVTADSTEIRIVRQSITEDKPGIRFYLRFLPSKKPYDCSKFLNPPVNAYAYLMKDTVGGDNKQEVIATVSNMADFDAIKSGRYLSHNANSIDLLAEFITSAGIASDAAACTKLAKVIAALLLDPMYKDKVTDTFIKFADNIIDNVKNNGFVTRMSQDFVTVKQSKGMQAFRTELPKSYDALTKPKTADATKK